MMILIIKMNRLFYLDCDLSIHLSVNLEFSNTADKSSLNILKLHIQCCYYIMRYYIMRRDYYVIRKMCYIMPI